MVSAVKDKVVRVKNGPAFNGAAEQKLFVVQGKEAVPRMLQTGESNFDYMEIKSGLKPGEQVIVSDMQDFVTKDRVQIKN